MTQSPWPTFEDYSNSVLLPAQNFSDPDLRSASPETDSNGIPVSCAGNFAVVFRFVAAANAWAVRCFSRPLRDQEERYKAIGAHLARAALPCTPRFTFLKQGIRFGTWYPILKMEWVEGPTLNRFIEKNLGRRAVLERLADWFRDMARSFRPWKIAHGDFHPLNIIVTKDGLVIVDLDGMFVPALAGRASLECGHENFQHPRRTLNDFDESIDDFSAWLIWFSIRAIALDPTLWQLAQGGDDALLFRAADFAAPERSAVLAAMSRSPIAELREIAQQLNDLFRFPLDQVPPFDPSPASPESAEDRREELALSEGRQAQAKGTGGIWKWIVGFAVVSLAVALIALGFRGCASRTPPPTIVRPPEPPNPPVKPPFHPDEPKESVSTAEDFFKGGREEYDKGNFDGAIDEFDRALELRKDYAEAYRWRGNAKKSKKDFYGAINDYGEALRLAGGDADLHYNRGLCFLEREDRVSAMGDLRRALDLAPPDWPFRAAVQERLDALRK